MIKFFRKIRQNSIKEKKFINYLKYALGEIVLVVIGILMALQINNWNENRLNEKRIKSYLQSFITDLKSDILVYKRNINEFEITFKNINRILLNDEYRRLDADSIYALINYSWSINTLSDQTFEKIKSVGLQEILGTPEIEKAINDYYTNSTTHYDYFINWNKEMAMKDNTFWNYNDKYETGINNYLGLNSIPFHQNPEKRKEELIKLIESTLGRNYLKNTITRMKYGTIEANQFKSNAENLIELIENEINK
ncbi:MAG: DUF6090 family protein [Gelidibacter sp.]